MVNKGLLVLLCSVTLLAACSRTEPKISYGTMRMVYYQTEERPEERFSFFVLPEDDDGIEDIAELYIYHDKEGLSWRLTSDDWVSYEFDGKTWIGTYSIAMMDEEPLPRGQFRAVLVDKGGERSERVFAFDAPEDSRYPFPFLTIENGRYFVESGYPEHSFICYNAQGEYVNTIALTVLDGAIADLKLPSAVRAVALWAEDSEYMVSALTDVASLP
jgi:major membrane immunogen (membrane-anchored lipoprotein)